MLQGENVSRFWLYHCLVPLAFFVFLATLFEFSNIDLALSDRFYDFTNSRWFLHDAWWTEQLIHSGGRKLILVIALAALTAWGLSFRLSALRPWRRAALYFVLSIGIGTGLVALGKATTNRHCPWDYDRYGGSVPYVRLFEQNPPGCSRGNCFPAGHASGGFAMMSGYFIFYKRNRRLAIGILVLGLALGSLFGFAQVARGAHFVSHNIWTAAICWFAALLLYTTLFRGRLWSQGHRSDKDSGDLTGVT